MLRRKAARNSCSYSRAKDGSRRTRSIVADWEQGTLVAGLLVAVSFGLMFVWAAVMW